MVPLDLKDFIIASLGASASFIGLLFVGLSVVIQKVGDQKIAETDRILAESSYAGLINVFFVCLTATLPHATIGDVCLVMSLIGLFSCYRLRHYKNKLSLLVSVVIYLLELDFALNILMHQQRLLNVGQFEGIIIALFSISLIKAWSLTGVREVKHSKTK